MGGSGSEAGETSGASAGGSVVSVGGSAVSAVTVSPLGTGICAAAGSFSLASIVAALSVVSIV